MTRDVRERRRLADEVRELLGDPDVDALLSCLPREHAHHRDERRVGRLGCPVVAHHHDAAAAGVVVQRVRADDTEPVDGLARRHLGRRIVTRPTALPDATARIDDEVVRDVGPAASLAMELVDRADVGGDVAAEGGRGVMDDQLLDRRVRDIRQALGLVGTPGRSGKDDRRRHVDRRTLELAVSRPERNQLVAASSPLPPPSCAPAMLIGLMSRPPRSTAAPAPAACSTRRRWNCPCDRGASSHSHTKKTSNVVVGVAPPLPRGVTLAVALRCTGGTADTAPTRQRSTGYPFAAKEGLVVRTDPQKQKEGLGLGYRHRQVVQQ